MLILAILAILAKNQKRLKNGKIDDFMNILMGSMLKSVTTSFEMVSNTNNFRINNEIENLIKMSKVDFEK